jgi:hypothetical protein
VEEGNVRDDIPGSRNLGSRDYWVGVRELGELGRLSFRAVDPWVVRNGRSHRTGRTEGAGTRVCGYAIKNSESTVV